MTLFNDFNENFNNFLSECKYSALKELKSDRVYAEQKNAQAALRSKLETVSGPEIQKLLDDYIDISIALQSIENNKVFLCGLTIQSEISKRFDPLTPEHKELTN